MDISSKITELRKQKGWSQYQLSKQIEVSREIIGRYERGDAMPSIEIVKKLLMLLALVWITWLELPKNKWIK